MMVVPSPEPIRNLNTGFIKDLTDSSDYTYLAALRKVFKDSNNLRKSKIKFGLWTSRDTTGEIQKSEIQIGVLSSVTNNITIKLPDGSQKIIENLESNQVLVPLNLFDFFSKKTTKIQLELCNELLPHKDSFPSLALDGKDDYVEIEKEESKNFNFDNEFTIEAWIKVASLQPDTQYDDNDIIEKWDGREERYPFVIRYKNSSGQIIAARYDGLSNPPTVSSKKIVNNGKFHHIAFVKQGKKLLLYLDGEKQDETEDTTQKTNNNSPLYFGCRGGNRNYFKGQISEIRIWNVARNLEQINDSYQECKERKNQKNSNAQSTKLNQKELVGYWNFKDEQELPETASLHGLPAWMKFEYWPPVNDQGKLNSCTAQAGASLLEYFENRASGRYSELSRLFIYKVARNLMGLEQEAPQGASIRQTMAAMEMFGVPLERYWPNHTFLVDQEPSAFAYGIAKQNRVTSYCRLDRAGMDKLALLDQIKVFLYADFPVMFGFPLNKETTNVAKYGYKELQTKGRIPFSFFNENYREGHAVIAVGYKDDEKIYNPITQEQLKRIKEEIKNQKNSQNDINSLISIEGDEIKITEFFKKFICIEPKDGEQFISTTGAFLIRNSWGSDWGENGYGWLPYAYVLEGLAVDWWSLLKAEWLHTGNFGLIEVESNGGMTLKMPEERTTSSTG